MPLPLGKPENLAQASSEAASPLPARPRRGTGKAPESGPFAAAPASGPLRKTISQSLSPAQALQSAASAEPLARSGENATALISDEDVVIFEQLRHQLLVWLRVEAVRSGAELGNQGAFQLVDLLRRQEGMDLARLQVVSTLLNMCDQIISSGKATLFDYKQAMMFYLMHTRRTV